MMYNEIVSPQAIISSISAYQIFRYYMPDLDYGKVIPSPFRVDNSPSFGIFEGRNGDARFRDLKTSESGDYLDFVGKLFKLDFKSSLNKVNFDMELGLSPSMERGDLPITKSIIVENTEGAYKKVISVVRRAWNDGDIRFWNAFGLTIAEVEASNTYPIVTFRIDGGVTQIADQWAYTMDFYAEDDGIMMRKIYQPFSKTIKWRTNLNNTVVDGIKNLTNNELLIITKSRKDRLVLNSYGYDSISTNSETSFIPPEVWEKLKRKYRKIILFFDNDEAGITQSGKFEARYDLPYVLIPSLMGVKDISDCRRLHGHTNTEKLLKSLFRCHS